MADGTSFQIDLPVTGAAGVESAAASLTRLTDELTAAGLASTAAADAVKAGEAAYRQAETSADKAAKALEKIGLAADAQRAKLKAAQDAGDLAAAARADTKLKNLVDRQSEAASKAQATAAAMAAEAVALDKLKVSAGAAADAEAKVSKSLDAAKAASNAAAKAQAAAAGSGKANEAAEAFGKLGGPIGQLGQKLFGAKAGLDKMSASLGSTKGLLAAGAIGAAAYVAAIVAVGAAAIAATVSVLKWSFALDPKNTERLNSQTKTLQKNLAGVFSLNFSKLLDGFDKIVALFDSTTVTGKAMKVVFESLFQPIVDGLTDLIPKVIATFIQFEIWALKGLIAIKPYGSKIALVAEGLGIMAAVIVGVVVVAVALFVGILAAAAAGVVVIGEALTWVVHKAVEFASGFIAAVGGAFDWVSAKVTAAIDFLKSLSLADIGKAMIDGLVTGITGGAGQILSAMTGAVSGAIDGAKKLLGIASPSKVFAEIGMNTGEGMAQGVQGAVPNVQGALESMVSPSSAENAAASAGQASAASSGSVAGNTFNFYGVEGAEDAISRFEGVLTRILEGDAAQLGSAVPNA